MTIEELFTEEYRSLKKENKELKSSIEGLRGALDRETNIKLDLYGFMHSLKLQKATYGGKKYLYLKAENNVIWEGSEFYELASEFAKDEPKKEEEK